MESDTFFFILHGVSVDKYAINQINDIVGGQDLWRNF